MKCKRKIYTFGRYYSFSHTTMTGNFGDGQFVENLQRNLIYILQYWIVPKIPHFGTWTKIWYRPINKFLFTTQQRFTAVLPLHAP